MKVDVSDIDFLKCIVGGVVGSLIGIGFVAFVEGIAQTVSKLIEKKRLLREMKKGKTVSTIQRRSF